MVNELQTHSFAKRPPFILVVIYLLLGVCSRILPHFPNVTAMTSLSIVMGKQFPRFWAVISILVSLIISDLILAYLFHYPVWGAWVFFNYSGFILISLCAAQWIIPDKKTSVWVYLLCSSMGFWLWTNFGTWLTSGMYPHSLRGFFLCYIAALPFLRNAALGDFCWMLFILAVCQLCMPARKYAPQN